MKTKISNVTVAHIKTNLFTKEEFDKQYIEHKNNDASASEQELETRALQSIAERARDAIKDDINANNDFDVAGRGDLPISVEAIKNNLLSKAAFDDDYEVRVRDRNRNGIEIDPKELEQTTLYLLKLRCDFNIEGAKRVRQRQIKAAEDQKNGVVHITSEEQGRRNLEYLKLLIEEDNVKAQARANKDKAKEDALLSKIALYKTRIEQLSSVVEIDKMEMDKKETDKATSEAERRYKVVKQSVKDLYKPKKDLKYENDFYKRRCELYKNEVHDLTQAYMGHSNRCVQLQSTVLAVLSACIITASAMYAHYNLHL